MYLGRIKPRAGRGAHEWYVATLRPWRSTMRLRTVVALAPVVAGFAGLALIWPDWLPFYAGMAGGTAVTVCVWALDSPPEWIERKRRGRDGERRTERLLRPLEREGWTVVHDVLGRWGNLDHIVLSAKGAYVLETKCLHGRVAFDAKGMVVHRGEDERDRWRPFAPLDRPLRGAAAALQRELSGAGLRWVDRVVVLWCEFDEGVREVDGTAYVHGSQLASWLRGRDVRLSERVVGDASAILHRIEARGALGAADLRSAAREATPAE